MKSFIISLVLVYFLFTQSIYCLDWVKKPTIGKIDNTWFIEFELDTLTDVEVCVKDATTNKIIKHIGAAVLGENPPKPFIPNSKYQKIEWDGLDDYGSKIDNENFIVEVKVGLALKLQQMVGGNPYSLFSTDMGGGDHAAWRLHGLEIKKNGKVYLLANSTNIGQPVIKEFDIDGTYIKTVFPPPANLPYEKIQGWGAYKHSDDEYSYAYSDLGSVALSNTFISGFRAPLPDLIPSPSEDELVLSKHFNLLKIKTDGSLEKMSDEKELLITKPSYREDTPEKSNRSHSYLTGHFFTHLMNDKKHLLIGGLYAAQLESWRLKRAGAKKDSFWHDGQIFKLNLKTKEVTSFWSLPAEKVIVSLDDRSKSSIADAKYGNYSAIQGVTEDNDGNIFACDRQNERIIILNKNAELIREIKCKYPDAIAVSPISKALYVTTRFGHYHGAGTLKLLKFNDWQKDDTPANELTICAIQHFDQKTYLETFSKDNTTYVWLAYTTIPAQIYIDDMKDFKLLKSFYEIETQSALDLSHITVDPNTETLYVSDSFCSSFVIENWEKPAFKKLVTADDEKWKALSLAYDPVNNYFYNHSHMSTVTRYQRSGLTMTPVPFEDGSTSAVTHICNDWRIGLGMGDRGMAISNRGIFATLGVLQKGGAAYSGPLHIYQSDKKNGLWKPLQIKHFGDNPTSAGVKFDIDGNLYAAKTVGTDEVKAMTIPDGLNKNSDFFKSTGFIYQYQIKKENEKLIEPQEPSKIYQIPYGSISYRFSRTPRFGLDQQKRIYYPTSLLPKVSVIDNNGNHILSFGTWGNIDSKGGLEGDTVKTKDIPLAWPNSVEATDNYVYVSDIINRRVLRLKKEFKLFAQSK